MIVLSAVGLVRIRETLPKLLNESTAKVVARVPVVALFVLIATNLFAYTPVRIKALHDRAAATNKLLNAPAREGVTNAVIFAPPGFAAGCSGLFARGWVFWRPNPDPWFEDDIIWANHISVTVNRRLMRFFPDRKGYVLMVLKPCTVGLIPLDEADPKLIGPGRIGGTEVIPPPPPAPTE
jgi:hypothetical protein